MSTVSTKCVLFESTLTSHEPMHICGEAYTKHAERFRTGSMIHDSKSTFGYFSCQLSSQKSSQKCCTQSYQKFDTNTTEMTTDTQTKLIQKTKCTEHMGSRNDVVRVVVSSEEVPLKKVAKFVNKNSVPRAIVEG